MSAIIFLSASTPPEDLLQLRERLDAWEDLYQGFPTHPREVERAICEILPYIFLKGNFVLRFGGHPVISPMIVDIARRRPGEYRIELYQSAFFAGEEPFQENDEALFRAIQWIPICKPGKDESPLPLTEPFPIGEHPLRTHLTVGQQHAIIASEKKKLSKEETDAWRQASLLHMRTQMLQGCTGAIFIGGMKGISDEFELFERLNPCQPSWLITRPGGRTARLAQQIGQKPYRHIEREASYDLIGINLGQQIKQMVHSSVSDSTTSIATPSVRNSRVSSQRLIRGHQMNFSNEQDRQQHLANLRSMLKQIAVPNEGLEGLNKGIQTEAAVDSETLELVETGIKDLEEGKPVSESQRYVLEAIVLPKGRPVYNIINDDYASTSYPWTTLNNPEIKNRIKVALRSIGRIELPENRFLPYGGTGFLVGKDLLMTNRHVANLFANGFGLQELRFDIGQSASIDFKQEIVPSESLLFQVRQVVMIHPYWDMALLRVTGVPEDRLPLTLSTRHPDELLEHGIVVVGYPFQDRRNDMQLQNEIFAGIFGVKRLQPGKLTGRARTTDDEFRHEVNALTHDSSTLGGNSGSALVSLETGEIVGLHFGGKYLKANYSVPSFELARDDRIVQTGLNFNGLVKSTTEWDKFWQNSLTTESVGSRSSSSATSDTTNLPAVGDRSGRSAILAASELRPNNQVSPIIVNNYGTIGTFNLTSPPMRVLPTDARSADITLVSGTPPEPITSEGLFGGGPDLGAIDAAFARFRISHFQRSTFNFETALSACAATHLVYKPAAEVEQTLLGRFGFTTGRFINSGATQAFVASTPDAVLVCFRGTDSVRDWLINLRAFSTPTEYGSIHTGFYHAFRAIEPLLDELVTPLVSGRKLVLAGHSLGGALAVVAAAVWAARYSISYLYTFGQPRVGLENFREYLRQKLTSPCFRIVNNDDIVPTVPTGGYVHFGQLTRFDANGRISEQLTESLVTNEPQMSSAELSLLQESLLAARQQNATAIVPIGTHAEGINGATTESVFTLFSDHGLDQYMRKILMQLQ